MFMKLSLPFQRGRSGILKADLIEDDVIAQAEEG
jgi:hypothetical protein